MMMKMMIAVYYANKAAFDSYFPIAKKAFW